MRLRKPPRKPLERQVTMWVRSQDGINLIRATVFHIVTKKDMSRVIRAKVESDSGFVTLGRYESDDEALQVLSQISREFNKNFAETGVFQMPKIGFNREGD